MSKLSSSSLDSTSRTSSDISLFRYEQVFNSFDCFSLYKACKQGSSLLHQPSTWLLF
ncbi:hypothetical protein COCVIDRAFT_110626 [Bipolaris victoriae FI3]|uniref:Uncharacterized protein n=1 Tax=Bipolaris victoriae (strain FI3) TaxID=930091 RepID=W7E9V3_BIPV3|nr:hypothetical protein COCVIDRAFT_110626 [Bipolaris victoriae FI3]